MRLSSIPYSLFLIPYLILLSACTPQRPSGVLSEGKMEDVLVDYHLALAMAEVQDGDLPENRYLLTQAALRKHGVSEAELDTSMVYWCRNSEKMAKICERVSKRLSYMAETQGVDRQEKNRYSYLATEGDTANVWNLRNDVVLLPTMVDNIYSFSIDADSSFLPGDYFMWAFKTQFLSSDHANEAYALLSIQYANDSIMGTSQRMTSSREVEIKLRCAAAYRDVPIRSISGTIYMPLRDKGFGILVASDFALVRYHDLTMAEAEIDEAAPEVQDSTRVPTVADTTRVRRNPYDIRGDQGDRRTIDIVRDKPIRPVVRRR